MYSSLQWICYKIYTQNKTTKLHMNNAGQLSIKTYFIKSVRKLDITITVIKVIC